MIPFSNESANMKNHDHVQLAFIAVLQNSITNLHSLLDKPAKKQISLSDDTKFTHQYFFVVTSIGQEFTSDEILRLYRLRWQVEMVFKRYKSILKLGSIPTKTDISSLVWLNCKMLIALLIEKILSEVDFPPCADSSEFMERDDSTLRFDFHSVLYNR